MVALQETKAHPEQLDEDVREPAGWESRWASSTVKKGYSGVAVLSRVPFLSWSAEPAAAEISGVRTVCWV